MAISTIKATFSLDIETTRTLESLAKRWGTTKSEALRRAIRAAVASQGKAPEEQALDQLHRRAKLTADQAEAWISGVRQERRAR